MICCRMTYIPSPYSKEDPADHYMRFMLRMEHSSSPPKKAAIASMSNFLPLLEQKIYFPLPDFRENSHRDIWAYMTQTPPGPDGVRRSQKHKKQIRIILIICSTILKMLIAGETCGTIL